MDDSEVLRCDDADDETGGDVPSLFAEPVPVAQGDIGGGETLWTGSELGTSLETSGDGHADDPWWQQQSQNGLCMPVSAAIVISEFLGDPFDLDYEAELVGVAERLELPDGRPALAGEPGAWEGMSLEGGVALLEHYGIDAHVEHGDVSILQDYLHEGRSIILAVDSDEVWSGIDDDFSAHDAAADHALVILDIDENTGVAVLQDPGNPQGRGYELSIDALQAAWGDSGNGMVVTDPPAPGPAWETAPADEDAASSADTSGDELEEQAAQIRAWSSAGAVILPILLGSRALVRRRARA